MLGRWERAAGVCWCATGQRQGWSRARSQSRCARARVSHVHMCVHVRAGHRHEPSEAPHPLRRGLRSRESHSAAKVPASPSFPRTPGEVGTNSTGRLAEMNKHEQGLKTRPAPRAPSSNRRVTWTPAVPSLGPARARAAELMGLGLLLVADQPPVLGRWKQILCARNAPCRPHGACAKPLLIPTSANSCRR